MIELVNLTKRFGQETAVDHLDLNIRDGELFGLLGPNGAGKTTTVSMLSTVLLPTEGKILLDGVPLTRGASAGRRRISVITQEYSLRQDMNMDEIMEYQGRLYRMRIPEIREKTEELLAYAGLSAHRKKRVRQLSGGMKRKLMIIRALLTSPDILLLDEPTAGMDAVSRRQTWDILRTLRERKITILLTTHFMEEAEKLCDRVAFLQNGKLGGIDTPAGWIRKLGKYTVEVFSGGKSECRYFTEQEAALSFYRASFDRAVLRDTTLEDVFIHGYYHGTVGKVDGVQA